MLKALILLILIITQTSYGKNQNTARLGIDAGGGYIVETNESRVLGIDAGGGRKFEGVQLLKLERISGSNASKLEDARPVINSFRERAGRLDMITKMMKLKVLADFEDISEITLKDGTVIKAEELLRKQ